MDRLLEISDEGAGGGAHPRLLMAPAAAYDMGSTPELIIDPQLQTVRAAVVIRVAITDPTSL